MKEYQRHTKGCRFSEFAPETIQSFRKYFEKNELGSIEAEIQSACETNSTRLKQSFFGKLFGSGNFAYRTSVFYTGDRLFWCQTDQKNQNTVLSAKLKEIEVKDFASDLVEDSGIQVFGFVNQSHEKILAFIGLGEEPVALEFKRKLKETINLLNSN